jgi:uncharacterized protein
MSYPQPAQAPEATGLSVRRLEVDLSAGFPRHWHGGDAFRTAYYNALSMSFPAGEQRFIDSVREAAKRLPDLPAHTALRRQLQDFCAQEATHRHVHAQFNAELERQGLDNAVERRIHARFERYRHINPMHHLGVTVAYEHFTAVLSDALLRNPAATATMTPAMQSLWRWHALEETEHKAVAFDLYQALGGNHRWRVRWFVFVTLQFYADVARQTFSNLRRDGSAWRPSTWWSAATFFFGRPSRGGGWVWTTARPLAQFLRRDFHPWQHDNRGIASAYAEAHASEWRLVR